MGSISGAFKRFAGMLRLLGINPGGVIIIMPKEDYDKLVRVALAEVDTIPSTIVKTDIMKVNGITVTVQQGQ